MANGCPFLVPPHFHCSCIAQMSKSSIRMGYAERTSVLAATQYMDAGKTKSPTMEIMAVLGVNLKCLYTSSRYNTMSSQRKLGHLVCKC